MKITIIGSGNVGTALALSLNKAGHTILEICGRNERTVVLLGKKVKANAVFRIKEISPLSDLYIICVNDQSIEEVVAHFPFQNKAVLHTSGATSLSVLSKFKQYGVLYPVNSVSSASFSFNGTPFCLDASNKKLTTILKSLVKDLKGSSYFISDQQRLVVHLAAVFANNFSNALYQSAYELLQHEQIPFEILAPLITETASKIKGKKPAQVQTGPAVREDAATLAKHLQLLEKEPGIKKVYQLMTNLIRTQKINS